MMMLDDASDPLADELRDAMDPVWYALTEQERQFLNGRGTLDTGEGRITFSSWAVPFAAEPAVVDAELPDSFDGWEVKATEAA